MAHQGHPWGISQEHIAGGEGTRILISCFYLADFFKGRYSKGSVSVWLIDHLLSLFDLHVSTDRRGVL